MARALAQRRLGSLLLFPAPKVVPTLFLVTIDRVCLEVREDISPIA